MKRMSVFFQLNRLICSTIGLVAIALLVMQLTMPTPSWAYKNEFYDREPATKTNTSSRSSDTDTDKDTQSALNRPSIQPKPLSIPRQEHQANPKRLPRPSVLPHEASSHAR